MVADKQAQQRKQVWSAVQSLLGCGGLIALIAFVYWLLGRLPSSVASGPNVIVFIERGLTNNWLFWALLVGTIAFFVLLGVVKTTWGAVLVCAIFAGAAGVTVWSLYGRVAAIAFVGDGLELRYVWPRPASTLGAKEIISATSEESVRTGDDLNLMEYSLHLRTQRGDYASFSTSNSNEVTRAVRGIEAMRKR